MAAELNPQQRDALFRRILVDFSAFEDLQRFIEAGNLEQSHKLGRVIADGFRLLADGGLGWAPRVAEPVTLTLPAVELRRIMTRIRDEAIADYEDIRPDREEAQREWNQIIEARDACTAVLRQIAS